MNQEIAEVLLTDHYAQLGQLKRSLVEAIGVVSSILSRQETAAAVESKIKDGEAV